MGLENYTDEELEKELKIRKTEREKEYIEFRLDNGQIKKKPPESFSKCPKCDKKGVRLKELYEGGGIACIYCPYWECY